MPVPCAEAIHLKIEESSQFLQANAVAQRVRQLIMGAAPKVKTPSRRPTAIALAELKAGKLEVYDPREAAELLAEDSEDLSEEERAAAEAARASFEQMFAEAAGGDAHLDASPDESAEPAPEPEAGPGETAASEADGTEAPVEAPVE